MDFFSKIKESTVARASSGLFDSSLFSGAAFMSTAARQPSRLINSSGDVSFASDVTIADHKSAFKPFVSDSVFSRNSTRHSYIDSSASTEDTLYTLGRSVEAESSFKPVARIHRADACSKRQSETTTASASCPQDAIGKRFAGNALRVRSVRSKSVENCQPAPSSHTGHNASTFGTSLQDLSETPSSAAATTSRSRATSALLKSIPQRHVSVSSNNNNSNNDKMDAKADGPAQPTRWRPLSRQLSGELRKKESLPSIAETSTTASTPVLPSLFSSVHALSGYSRFPCSTSLVDLIVLAMRYKDTCQRLVDLIVPAPVIDTNHQFFRNKLACLNNSYQNIFNFIEVYANNMLALEICGTSKRNLESFFSKELVEEVFAGKLDDSIWGCRHKLRNCTYTCRHFINKNAKYISDKYEPISETMCVRLNNVHQLKELRKYVYQRYVSLAQRQYSHLLRIKSRHTAFLFHFFKMEVYKVKVVNKTVELKLEKLSAGLVSLLVSRFNLFCKKTKLLLLSHELEAYPIHMRIKPLVDFLTCNFDMLKRQLYPVLFSRFMRLLWAAFYENFVELMKRFNEESRKNPKQEALTYLKLIDILVLKFKEYTQCGNWMELKIKELKFILNMYSRDSKTLILLYYKLFNFKDQRNMAMHPVHIPEHFDLIHLVRISKKLRRPFHGRFFVTFLRKHPPQHRGETEPTGKDGLIRYAQSLLEFNYLTAVETIKRRPKKRATTHQEDDDVSFSGSRGATGGDETPIDSIRSARRDKNREEQWRPPSQTPTFNLAAYDQIYLATRSNYYQLNASFIDGLTSNLLFRNDQLNQEMEMLFGSAQQLANCSQNAEADELVDGCLESALDHELVLRILWLRIYIEPIVMKFLSMRYSNYASNLHIETALQLGKDQLSGDTQQRNQTVAMGANRLRAANWLKTMPPFPLA